MLGYDRIQRLSQLNSPPDATCAAILMCTAQSRRKHDFVMSDVPRMRNFFAACNAGNTLYGVSFEQRPVYMNRSRSMKVAREMSGMGMSERTHR